MKTNMKYNLTMYQRLLPIVGVLLMLTASPAAMAQQTVFYDTFGSSTINGGPTTNMIPGGTPTASFTSYEIGSGKNATPTTNFPGHLLLTLAANTTSGNSEAQALFTRFPVTLATNGDYIELDVTFVDTTNIESGLAGNTTGPLIGLYNSGGVPPLAGTLLWNGGFGSATTASTGGTVNWLGYVAGMFRGLSTSTAWTIAGRPAQTTANNTDQQLLYGAQSVGSTSANPGTFPFPNLTVGSPYTAQLRITLSAAGTLTVSNAMFAGTDTTGTIVWTNKATYTGANFLTTNFDGLAVGDREGASAGPGVTNDFTSIKVIASLAAQAGPYFFLTTSGDPCSGGITIGLSGSVTTNIYLLYTNGVDSGQSVVGNGSAISFGLQTVPAIYTVIASNLVTASMGPMYGNAIISAPGVTITSQPASVTVVTNVMASFSAAANGTALTYQWYKNGVALTNGGDISGAQTTNLVIYPTQAADAATVANGYYVVAQNPCGISATSAPNVSLTLTPQRNVVWAGGNPDNNWEYTESNFTLSGSPTTFIDGDIVTFDDTSGNKAVTITTNVVPTSVIVNSASGYTFNGSGKLTGFGKLVDIGLGIVTIVNNSISPYDYTGGTIVSNGATLTIGDGTSVNGAIGGIITVSTNGTLNYNYAGAGTVNSPINLANGLAGSGTVNYNDANGSILATPVSIISSNFNGIINVQGYAALHASDNNAGYALGNGSTVNVPANTQAWLDRSATSYNNTFNIAGTGWQGATPQTGAMRVFNCTVNGPVNLLANARIGGTINGATIQSVISGAYQLEVWGNTNSFVLVLGPTNGSPQGYSSTLITAGAISAANSNAISSGPLVVGEGGDMQVNGNNVTVANLSSTTSASGGLVTLIEGPRVRNMNTTNTGTLTVGTDGTSTEFDGTFSDGSTAPFGLTKVGAGTFTLTGNNTNTGPVTVNGGKIALSGSGSFSKASILAVATGATLDVSGRGDSTLTLNANQTLKHSGSSTGPINVTGSVNLGSGTLLLAVNHSGLVHDSLTVSGSTTYNGTLAVTNIGAALQAGDQFQLFASGVSGFTSFNLQTNDVINNVKYTWNNTVVSDGKVTVASVSTLINTNAPHVQVSVSGSTLNLGWPTNAGWTLLTNSVGLAATNQWFPYPNSANLTNVSITINLTKTNVFFKMQYPYP
jgi:fibronectin-binding autotransporter adhesin